MAKIDYAAEAKTIRLAFVQDGLPATVMVGTPGAYNIATGTTVIGYTEYSTHAFSKNFSVKDEPVVSPETIELSFHAGTEANPLPDLMDVDDIKIKFDDKLYKVLVVKVIRPAGITLLYKVRVIEDQEE